MVNSDDDLQDPSPSLAVDDPTVSQAPPNFLVLEDRDPVIDAGINDDDDDDEEEEEVAEPVKHSADGMPSMGYTDEQMLSLMNLITEHRVYVKSSKRFSQKPVKAKWEDVAKQFFATWTKLRPLRGPGLKKSYTHFASQFISLIHDDHSNLSALTYEPIQGSKL